jgi:hypothetical protein
MHTTRRTAITLTLSALLAIGAAVIAARNAAAQAAPKIGFFITSAGPGDGANLGGVAGADKHCQRLAAGVGAGDRTWRAYLSATGDGKQAAVNARDRIGKGPWYNAKGVLAAQNVADLHGEKNKLSKEVSLSEKGEMINGRGDNPNRHDVLTGSQADGTALPGDPAATTCGNWTSNASGSTQVGHHDRQGGGTSPTSWNAAHMSKGCSQANLQGTGGDGLFYCFAQ